MRIALVEPSRTVRRIVIGMIEAWGHSVCAYSDADEALASLRTDDDIRALITCAELPSGSGVQLCSHARALAGAQRPLYIIMMSSGGERAKLVQALDSGADDFIAKPPAPEELRARLRAAERLTSMQVELVRLATTDTLTGLLTRRAFFETVDKFWTGAEGRPLSVVVCDLDKFKLVNDTYGHDVGDLVLRGVSEQAQLIGVPVGRLGGEEFVFLLQEQLDAAIEIADRFRQAVAELVIHAGDQKIGITCSLGAAERGSEDTIDKLLRRADVSMYEAKRSGRNRVVATASLPKPIDHDHFADAVRPALHQA